MFAGWSHSLPPSQLLGQIAQCHLWAQASRMGGSEVEAARISRPVHGLAALASIASLAGCVSKPQTALPGSLLSCGISDCDHPTFGFFLQMWGNRHVMSLAMWLVAQNPSTMRLGWWDRWGLRFSQFSLACLPERRLSTRRTDYDSVHNRQYKDFPSLNMVGTWSDGVCPTVFPFYP